MEKVLNGMDKTMVEYASETVRVAFCEVSGAGRRIDLKFPMRFPRTTCTVPGWEYALERSPLDHGVFPNVG
jgi:hypothetical protein